MQLLIFPGLFNHRDVSSPLGLLLNMQPADKALTELLIQSQFRQRWGSIQVINSQDSDHKAVLPRCFEKYMSSELNSVSQGEYVLVHNGSFLTDASSDSFDKIISKTNADLITVQVSDRLKAAGESSLLTQQRYLVGIGRSLKEDIEPNKAPMDWPHHILVRRKYLDALDRGRIKNCASDWKELLGLPDCICLHLEMAGTVLNLDESRGLLSLLLKEKEKFHALTTPEEQADSFGRIIGPVLLGKNVHVPSDAMIIGPAIVCDGASIGSNAVIHRSIIGSNGSIEANTVVQHQILINDTDPFKKLRLGQRPPEQPLPEEFDPVFRSWPFLSYARLGKRVFDILFSLVILILSLPIFAIVTVVIKVTSPGPLFYRARRQGLHGKEFDCLKFRTMIIQADAMQDRLRIVNQVDGPQFKIDDDPRITGAGKFLRDTCIDELPQFLNVLMGQMSVVGPRPSPESENQACPVWRDARLSVRPGITGLWQISRTRKIGMDFQEWVYYDMEYVRNLSFKNDMLICIRTAAKLIKQFLNQFG